MGSVQTVLNDIHAKWVSVHLKTGELVGYRSASGRYEVFFRNLHSSGFSHGIAVLVNTEGCPSMACTIATDTDFTALKYRVAAKLERWQVLQDAFDSLLGKLADLGWIFDDRERLLDSYFASDTPAETRVLEVLRQRLISDDVRFLRDLNWQCESQVRNLLEDGHANPGAASQLLGDIAMTGRLYQLADTLS